MDEHSCTFAQAEKYLEYVYYRRDWNTRLEKGFKFKDAFQRKVYRAEWDWIKNIQDRRLDHSEAQKLASKVFHSSIWDDHQTKDACQVVPEIVFEGPSRGNFLGRASYDRIRLYDKGQTLTTLLHELVHTNGHRHHDVTFRKTQVEFLRVFMGETEAESLQETYKKHRLPDTERQPMKIQPFEKWIKRQKI